MTYLVAGRLPEQNFMMVDCITTSMDTGALTLNDKVITLTTITQAYYTVTRNALTNDILNYFEIRAEQ